MTKQSAATFFFFCLCLRLGQGCDLVAVTSRGCYVRSFGGHQKFKGILARSYFGLPKMTSRSDQPGTRCKLEKLGGQLAWKLLHSEEPILLESADTASRVGDRG
jgi:hypothetical protein